MSLQKTYYTDNNLSIEDKNKIDYLEELLRNSGLLDILVIEDKYAQGYSEHHDGEISDHCFKFKPNNFYITYLWFPVFHNVKAAMAVNYNKIGSYDGESNTVLRNAIQNCFGETNKNKSVIHFKEVTSDNIPEFLTSLVNILNSPQFELPKSVSKSDDYKGLILPPVNTDEVVYQGQEFNWKEIIAISEDPDSTLAVSLNKKGIYMQKTEDLESRYIGSTYSNGGFLSRWMVHIKDSGNAKYLNTFVNEYGYNSIRFVILQILPDSSDSQIIQAESAWKSILNTRSREYNGKQLNNN